MRCPCCHKEKTGEYFHVLSTDIKDFHFNYCCTDCLSERLRVPRHIKFAFTENDKEEIRKIVKEELEKSLDINIKASLGLSE